MARVALLHNLNRGETERQTEYDSAATIEMLQGMIGEQHECQPIEATQAMEWVPDLLRYKPDVVFNTAEGFHGAAREAVYPAVLEQLGLAYCGPDPTNLLITLNKHLTKQLAQGIPNLNIPESHLVGPDFDGQGLSAGRYMLKLMHEGSSIGMRLADSAADVPKLAHEMNQRYGDSAIMAEAYVEGDDISMAFVEGIGTLGPAGVVLPEGVFYDYGFKSSRDEEVAIGPYHARPDQKQKLQAVTAGLVDRLDLRGYGKIDMRLGGDSVHLIEVNAQVSFHPEGEFAQCCLVDGRPLGDVVHGIITNALENPRQPSVGVRV